MEQEHTGEHILVCLSSAPSNAKIIRIAAQMVAVFHSRFTALFVETPDFAAATEENKRRLLDNRRLAQQLGASIETVHGLDVPYQIAEFARLSGVTKIVLGQSVVTGWHLLGKPTLTEQLLAYSPEIDIHIIPDQSAQTAYRPKKAVKIGWISVLMNAGSSVSILAAATLLSLLFDRLGFTHANIIMVYILGVLLTSIVTSQRVYSLISSVASVVIFNFLFTTPRFSLTAYETGYPVTFIVMFLTAYITGTFALSYKRQAAESAKTARRTQILFDTDQLLTKAKSRQEIIHAAGQAIKLLDRNIVVFEAEDEHMIHPYLFPQSGVERSDYDAEKELSAVRWALNHNQATGATTDHFPDARYLYLAVRVNERVYGVLGVEAAVPLDASEYSILMSILGECALALENERNTREKEAAAVLAESEQLRANLLRTISHDLRTPLTTISGNASSLLSNGAMFDESTKRQLYSDIYDDSMWLVDLVENLLFATRIEEGRMTLRASAELLSDIVEEAIRHVDRKAAAHQLTANCGDELLLVKADGKLIVQVIVNLVDNAVKYTPSGSSIAVTAVRRGNMAEISVADTGHGISDEEKGKVFDKFYCGIHKIKDNRRSLGLGLFLCKAIVETHRGTIWVSDNRPHGAVFSFTLPLEEVTLHE